MNKNVMKVFAALWILVLALAVAGQERFVRPLDEAGEDKSFLEFRKKLIDAAERKDAAYIMGILDPKVRVSFGGDAGIEDFKKFWELSTGNSRFWDEFLPVIKNGGSWYRENGQTIFTAPYTFKGFPDDLDSFEHLVVFGSNVNLRESPERNGKVLEKLSYNVVRVDDEKFVEGSDEKIEWYLITTLTGKTGWVKAEYIRSPIDYRAGFEKKNGKWKMIFFVAGD
ncbi:MAG TPA: SH3 domain-containing protein [Pyrinomonadaceae bacterium]|nr:SH3 domain-containing protein [Pyrinomonadaceae bacterium]